MRLKKNPNASQTSTDHHHIKFTLPRSIKQIDINNAFFNGDLLKSVIKLREALIAWKFKNSASGSSLFYYTVGTKVVYLLIDVEDILLTRNDDALIGQIVIDLNDKFSLKILGDLNYFLGFEVHRNSNGILLTQSKMLMIYR